MKTARQKATELREKLNNAGVSDTVILDDILNNLLSGQEAYEALAELERELFNDHEDFHSEKDHDSSSWDEED